jgi:hypothetical protein
MHWIEHAQFAGNQATQKTCGTIRSQSCPKASVGGQAPQIPTARYLKQQLAKADFTELDEVDSAVDRDRGEIINQFAPYYNGTSTRELKENGLAETRILISTDVLSEGLNLQDATRLRPPSQVHERAKCEVFSGRITTGSR